MADNAALEPLMEAFAIIQSRYVDPVETEALVHGALKGMTAALDDPHSAYLRPPLCEASRNFSGQFTGIGVTAKTDETTREIKVATVIPNTPAAAVGVRPGDVFHEVDGVSIVGLSLAELSALAPGPPGTIVTIVFKRGDSLITFDITRAAFETPNVSYDIVGDKIAHVSMRDFHERSRAQLDEALESLDINATAGLIFDIRNNPGGTLASAIEVGSAFVDEGVLLRQVARDQSDTLTHANGDFSGLAVPVVVLVDASSASASEVIAGALQDHGAATIIGETTFGKGTVQNLPALSDGSCLRLTVSHWLTPNGRWIHERGITPDIIIERETDADGGDRQLTAAIAFLESARD